MGQGTHEEDFVEDIFVTSSHNTLMFFTNYGRCFRMKCYRIPEAGRNAKGLPIVNLLQLQDGEFVTALFPVQGEGEEGYLVMCTRNGVIKKTALTEFRNIRKGGLIAQDLREGDMLIAVEYSSGDDEFLLATSRGQCVRFHERDVRAMGRTAAGVRGIRLEEGDTVVDMVKVVPGGNVLTVTENGMGKRTPEDQYTAHKRGGKGMHAMAITEKTGPLKCMRMTGENQDLMMIRDDGTVMRMPLDSVRIIARDTQGVKLMRIDEGTRIAGVEIVPHQEETQELPDGPEGVAAETESLPEA